MATGVESDPVGDCGPLGIASGYGVESAPLGIATLLGIATPLGIASGVRRPDRSQDPDFGESLAKLGESWRLVAVGDHF